MSSQGLTGQELVSFEAMSTKANDEQVNAMIRVLHAQKHRRSTAKVEVR